MEREREREREREKDGWLIDVFFILKTHPLHTKVSRKEVERSKGEAFIYYMIINTFSFKGFAPPLPSKKLKYNVFISFSILCLLSLSDQLIVSLSLFQCHTKAYLLVSSLPLP